VGTTNWYIVLSKLDNQQQQFLFSEIDGKSHSPLPDDRPYQTELLYLPEIHGKSTPLSRMAWFLCRVYQGE